MLPTTPALPSGFQPGSRFTPPSTLFGRTPSAFEQVIAPEPQDGLSFEERLGGRTPALAPFDPVTPDPQEDLPPLLGGTTMGLMEPMFSGGPPAARSAPAFESLLQDDPSTMDGFLPMVAPEPEPAETPVLDGTSAQVADADPLDPALDPAAYYYDDLQAYYDEQMA